MPVPRKTFASAALSFVSDTARGIDVLTGRAFGSPNQPLLPGALSARALADTALALAIDGNPLFDQAFDALWDAVESRLSPLPHGPAVIARTLRSLVVSGVSERRPELIRKALEKGFLFEPFADNPLLQNTPMALGYDDLCWTGFFAKNDMLGAIPGFAPEGLPAPSAKRAASANIAHVFEAAMSSKNPEGNIRTLMGPPFHANTRGLFTDPPSSHAEGDPDPLLPAFHLFRVFADNASSREEFQALADSGFDFARIRGFDYENDIEESVAASLSFHWRKTLHPGTCLGRTGLALAADIVVGGSGADPELTCAFFLFNLAEEVFDSDPDSFATSPSEPLSDFRDAVLAVVSGSAPLVSSLSSGEAPVRRALDLFSERVLASSHGEWGRSRRNMSDAILSILHDACPSLARKPARAL